MNSESELRNSGYETMVLFVREAMGLSESVSVELFPLEGRGSDRTFFRLIWNQKDSAILFHYDPKRVENTYYASIAVFLRDLHVSVPRLIRYDSATCLLLMEDLGNQDLCSLRETPWETRRILYQKTLTLAHRLHSFPEREFPSHRIKLMKGFGPDLYCWEWNYFREHFVKEVCGIDLEPDFRRKLETELAALSGRLLSTRRSLIHRDLQSQNVMIRDGEPFFIDFQGMRFGSPFYDLGSLLCDPYVDFSQSERDELLFFYYGLSKGDLNWAGFQSAFWDASAQRLMQALGAYGYLGLMKGLKAYLKYIPRGLRSLHLAATRAAALSLLQELSTACSKVIEQKGGWE